jgi:hypothetical protein
MSDNVPEEFTPQYLKQAFKAFKKRLKLTRLDEESSLGGGPFSKGGDSGIVAIEPPREYPRAVWEKLVQQGRLRNAGSGMYELVQDPNAPRGRE